MFYPNYCNASPGRCIPIKKKPFFQNTLTRKGPLCP